jgi:hypothetical protein
MRVYVPASLDLLCSVRDSAVVDGPFDAVAVTAGLREWYATSDADDLEYAAMARASDLALEAAVADRRVVVVVDADEVDVDVTDEPAGSVQLTRIERARIASFHVDDAAAIPAVRLARTALAKAIPGSMPWEVEHLVDHDLAWFARQELDTVIADLQG